jgi:CubicO group peptidase (beta-lactamase class C family)
LALPFMTLALSMPMAGSALAGPAAFEAQLDEIFADLKRPDAPGCAVGIFDYRDQRRIVRGYGMADISGRRPIDGDTMFDVASNSKQFTALAIAMLVEQGKLRLDDDIRRWFPEFPDYGRRITVAMLMYHSSGLPDYVGMFWAGGHKNLEDLSPADVFAMIVRQQRLQFVPGTQYAYNNSGYFLLAQLVERVSGQEFSDFVGKTILSRLGMRQAYMRGSRNPVRPALARGYVKQPDGHFEAYASNPGFGGSGGLMVSIDDLARFDADFQTGEKVWTPSLRKIALEPGTLSDGSRIVSDHDLFYAAGVNVGDWRGQAVVAHSGFYGSFVSRYVRFTTRKLSVMVMCNRADVSASKFADRVIDSYLGSEPGALAPPAEEATDKPDTPDALDPALRSEIAGRWYAPEIEATYDIAPMPDGRVMGVMVSSPRAPAPARSDLVKELRKLSSNVLRAGQVELILKRDAGGELTGFDMHIGRGGPIGFVRKAKGS